MSSPVAKQIDSINALDTNSVFLLDKNGVVYQNIEQVENIGVKVPPLFAGWHSLGGHKIRQIITTVNADQRVEVFALGGDYQIYHQWQLNTNDVNSPWSGWAGDLLLPKVKFKVVEAKLTSSGRIIVLAVDEKGVIHYVTQDSPSGGGAAEGFSVWNAWDNTDLAGNDVATIEAILNPHDGLMDLFVLGGDNGIYHRRQLNKLVLNPGEFETAEVWGYWDNSLAINKPNISLAGATYNTIDYFAIVPNAANALQIFALCNATSKHAAIPNIFIFNTKASADPGSAWSGWEIFDNTADNPLIDPTLRAQSGRIVSVGVVKNLDNGIDVFALTGDEVLHFWEDNNPEWSQSEAFLKCNEIIVLTDINAETTEDDRTVVGWGLGENIYAKEFEFFNQAYPF